MQMRAAAFSARWWPRTDQRGRVHGPTRAGRRLAGTSEAFIFPAGFGP